MPARAREREREREREHKAERIVKESKEYIERQVECRKGPS